MNLRKVFLPWAILVACLFPAALLPAQQSNISVNEKQTRLRLQQGHGRVILAVENGARSPVTVEAQAELLDRSDVARARAGTRAHLKPGLNRIEMPVYLPVTGNDDVESLLWYRLRYRVAPDATGPSDRARVSAGIVAISEIMPDLFVLAVTASRLAPGKPLQVRARAFHPVTQRGVAGVAVEGLVKFDEDLDERRVRGGITGPDGFVTLEFASPESASSVDITVKGRLGNHEYTVADSLEAGNGGWIVVSTDKPLYQPGQTLHMRALVLGPGRRAARGVDVEFQIRDSEETIAFKTTASTSRFGIATVDWPIPAGARHGAYIIEAEVDDDAVEATNGARVFIRPYELPSFSVTVTPDRPYYLPGQDAEIRVRANYLFGEPVQQGHVIVASYGSVHDNPVDDPDDVAEKYTAVSEGGGSFKVRIPLGEHFREMGSYRRFRDFALAAYFTDSSTGRTEHRRFNLRISGEPVHLYLRERGKYAPGLPLRLFIIAAYPDGRPAPCDVEVSVETQQNSDAGVQFPAVPIRVARVKTNRFGVARLDLNLPAQSDQAFLSSGEQRLSVQAAARDSKNEAGHADMSIAIGNEPEVAIETNRSLYPQGEHIEVSLASNQPDLGVVVEAVGRGAVLRSQNVRLKRGRAFVVLPWGADLRGPITVRAWTLAGASHSYRSVIRDHRTVLYPEDAPLALEARFDRAEYRPGTEANLNLRVRSGSGAPVETALGLVVFDTAVEERARTDHDFTGSSFLPPNDDPEIGGLRYSDLAALDFSKPVSNDIQLVAEALLWAGSSLNDPDPGILGEVGYRPDPRNVFQQLLEFRLAGAREALDRHYSETMQYPADARALAAVLRKHGSDADALHDPWARPLRPEFGYERERYVLRFLSDGPDKRSGTEDDFTAAEFGWPYFRPHGEAITRALEQHFSTTAEPLTNRQEAGKVLLRHGVNLAGLRDPWNRAYGIRLHINGTRQMLTVWSGPQAGQHPIGVLPDEFNVWVSSADYLVRPRAAIARALAAQVYKEGGFPRDDAEFHSAIAGAVDWNALRDPWGNPYYVQFHAPAELRGQPQVRAYSEHAQAGASRSAATDHFIYVRSRGPDGQQGTFDDFSAALYSRPMLVEQPYTLQAPPAARRGPGRLGGHGSIAGVITDPTGAVIPDATVTARQTTGGQAFKTTSDDRGAYVLVVPAGVYEVDFHSPGFQLMRITLVPVESFETTTLNATLQVGTVTETVAVSADTLTTVSVHSMAMAAQVKEAPRSLPRPLTTPRLRQNFQETLLWRPEIITGKSGRAQIKFQFADNITTWKLAAIASTPDGRVAVLEKDVRAFQPFFVEHDPPRMLTQGDEIDLPVLVRNYGDSAQAVQIEFKPERWFTMLSPTAKRSQVAAGGLAREVFSFRAVDFSDAGRQQVTARNSEVGDAVEKEVRVRPDGREVIEIQSRMAGSDARLDLTIPPAAIAGSVRAALKIYPNPAAHVADAVEGIMKRPYGCGEQTISSTYPSLLLLQYARASGARLPFEDRASKYLRQGYDRLLNYRQDGGAFGYWKGSGANTALTAYALRFLSDASAFIDVDQEVIDGARAWLIRQQRSDGSIESSYGRPATVTAYVAATLAQSVGKQDTAATAGVRSAVQRALAYLSGYVQSSTSPYLLASYSLAARAAGETQLADDANARLANLARRDERGTYWDDLGETPFHGWGWTGRIEQTALALQALSGTREESPSSARVPAASRDELIQEGTLFLLKAKDRYGVWHSSQATVNVARFLIGMLASRPSTGEAETISIAVDGKPAGTISAPPPGQLSGPVMFPLPSTLSAGPHRIELRRAVDAALANVQLVTSYYVPWDEAPDSAANSDLHMSVAFDRTEVKAGDQIRCHVRVERRKGSGMLLAEIGIPPGAEVERAFLQRLIEERFADVRDFEVHPDRVVFYVWPRAGRAEFEFAMRPRYGIRAQTPASLLYDYYNPEASVVVPPVRFVVR